MGRRPKLSTQCLLKGQVPVKNITICDVFDLGPEKNSSAKEVRNDYKGDKQGRFQVGALLRGKELSSFLLASKTAAATDSFPRPGMLGGTKKTGEQKFSSLSLSFGLHPLAESTSRKVLSITSFLWVIAQVIFSLLGRKKLVVLATFVCKVEAFVPSKKSSQ